MSVFLDRLAMEVSEWGKYSQVRTDVESWRRWGIAADSGSLVAVEHGGDDNPRNGAKTVTKAQWLQRRAELINEPCDSDATERAEWVAQDIDGEWYWYADKPQAKSHNWGFDGIGLAVIASKGKVPAGHDWRKTLRKVNSGTGLDIQAHEYGIIRDSHSHQAKGASSDALFEPISETVSFINLAKDEEAKHLLIDHLERLLDLRLHGLEQG